MSVRVGYVQYLNTLPLVQGLRDCRDLSLHAAVPSKLSGLLRRGEVDIALASLVDLARTPVGEPGSDLCLLPAGMIGCDGPTLTVRLYSRVAFNRATRLHADTDSHTSVVLARLLLRTLHGVDVEVVPFDARERVPASGPAHECDEHPETLLMIGDKVVTDSPQAVRYPHQMDLGEGWKQWTGLPFVYAVWMCRRGEAHDERILDAARLLDRQRRRNATRLPWIVASCHAERRWPADLASTYLTELLRYEVGEREHRAVDRFLSEAHGAGLLPACTAHWVDLGAPLPAGV